MNIPLNIDWRQILLHLFNFAILAGGLYLLLYRPVKQFMEGCQARYAEQDRQARQDRERARQLKEEYEAQLDRADAQIAQRRSAAEQELEQLRQRKTAEAEREAEAILTKARDSAQREREELLARTSKELVAAAVDAAEKAAWKSDPYEQFLGLTGRGDSHA